MHDGFEPLLPGFDYVEFDDLEARARRRSDENTAGFLVEPIQGEGGIRPASHEFMQGPAQGLRRARPDADPRRGAVRRRAAPARSTPTSSTASTPDIMAVGQGHRRRLPARRLPRHREGGARAWSIGTHGSTYGGNPLAMAAGEAVLDVVANEEFLAHVRADGRAAALGARADDPQPRPICSRSVRGTGPDARHQAEDRQPRAFVAHLRDNHGLLTVAAGDNVVPRAAAADHRRAAISPSSSRGCRPARGSLRGAGGGVSCGTSSTCPTPAATRSRRCSNDAHGPQGGARRLAQGQARRRRAARRPRAGDDLREELDPHPRVASTWRCASWAARAIVLDAATMQLGRGETDRRHRARAVALWSTRS